MKKLILLVFGFVFVGLAFGDYYTYMDGKPHKVSHYGNIHFYIPEGGETYYDSLPFVCTITTDYYSSYGKNNFEYGTALWQPNRDDNLYLTPYSVDIQRGQTYFIKSTGGKIDYTYYSPFLYIHNNGCTYMVDQNCHKNITNDDDITVTCSWIK